MDSQPRKNKKPTAKRQKIELLLPAELYGAETKRLKEKVRRNIERFPEDFMFRLTRSEKQELVTNCDRLDRLKPKLSDGEFENLKSQFVISSWGGMRRAKPYAFLKT